MKVTYFIQLFEDFDQCQWLRFNNNTPVGLTRESTLDQALEEAAGHSVVIILGATDVILTKVTLKANSRSQLLTAIPYALEEELAEDIDNLHFAVRTLDRNIGEQSVAVVSREFMEELFTGLSERNFPSIVVVPQILVVPYTHGKWSLFQQRDSAILRTDQDYGYGMDAINLSELMALETELYREKEHQDAEITGYNFTGKQSDDDVKGGDHEALAIMARYYLDCDGDVLNVLQGDFQLGADFSIATGIWGWAAGLIAVAGLLYLINLGIDSSQLSREAGFMDQAMRDLYSQIYKKDVKGEDPFSAMRKKMIDLQKSGSVINSSFISAIMISGEVFKRQQSTSINKLRFSNTKLELDIKTDKVETLEAMRQAIEKRTGMAELKGVENKAGVVTGRIEIDTAGNDL